VDGRAQAYLYDLLGEPVPYDDAVELQDQLAAARSQGAIPDTLVLLEHPPTLTLGRSTQLEQELPLGRAAYEALGWHVTSTERGGRSTFHGAGQLVAYPILDLRAHGQDLRRYVHDLQQALVLALGDLGVEARPGESEAWVGVFVEQRKIASIGIRAQSWIVSHGFALNVCCDLEPFGRFTACGLEGTPFTSVEAELGRPVALAEARAAVLERLGETFGLAFEPVPARAGAA
jgi:lipoate-protein ligase B